MYFIQHLLFPGKLVSVESADESQKQPVQKPQKPDDLSPHMKLRVEMLPPELLDILFVLQDLPPISTPDTFALDFPTASLPSSFNTPEAFAAGLYRILQTLDPGMAERWHWRDIRKVRRSIEVALQTGRLHSEIIADQRTETKRSG